MADQRIRCLICLLPKEEQEQVHQRILGDAGDLFASPPRPAVARLGHRSTSAWILAALGKVIGYKSVGAHRDNHLRPGANIALAKAARAKAPAAPAAKSARLARAPRKSEALPSIPGDADKSPVLQAAVAAAVNATEDLEEMQREVKSAVFAASKLLRLKTAALTAQYEKLERASPSAAKDIAAVIAKLDGPSAAEVTMMTGGATAYATLQRAMVATKQGKPGSALRDRGAEQAVASGLKAMLKNKKPPPIPGDIPADDGEGEDDLSFEAEDEAEEQETGADPREAVVNDRSNVVPLRPSQTGMPSPAAQAAPPAPASGSSSPGPDADATFGWLIEEGM